MAASGWLITDFEQVKKLIVILLLWTSQKKVKRLLLGWLLLTFSLCKTSLGETGCLGNPYFLFTGCLSIQFFYSPQHSQLSHLWLPTPHCAFHPTFTQSGYLCLPTLHFTLFPTKPLPREAENFSRGGNHSKHVSLLTYLA